MYVVVFPGTLVAYQWGQAAQSNPMVVSPGGERVEGGRGAELFSHWEETPFRLTRRKYLACPSALATQLGRGMEGGSSCAAVCWQNVLGTALHHTP